MENVQENLKVSEVSKTVGIFTLMIGQSYRYMYP